MQMIEERSIALVTGKSQDASACGRGGMASGGLGAAAPKGFFLGRSPGLWPGFFTSSVIAYESSLNPNVLGRTWVERCLGLSAQHQLVDDAVRERAYTLERQGIKALDALHLACAEAAGSDCFVTCDDRLVRRWGRMGGVLRVCNPVEMVQSMTGG